MDQNMNIEPKAGFFSRSYLKHIAAFFGLILLVGGSYFVWSIYFSPEAKYIQGVEKSMAELPGKIEAYKTAMEADTYGGKTPEETLNMFIYALKKGDVELASKYFALDDDTAEPNPEWFNGLKKMKEDGGMDGLLKDLYKMQPSNRDVGSDDSFEYAYLGKDGIVDYALILKFNEYSNVWKIESF